MSFILLTSSSISSGTSNVSITSANGPVSINTNGTNALYINASQQVGIGTTSPQAKLVISNSGAAGIEFFLNYPGGGVGTYIQNYNRSTSSYVNTAYEALSHAFNTSGTERMRIDSSGNLLVGTTTITSGRINTVTANGLYGLVIRDVQSNGAMILFQNSSGTTVGQITSDATNTAYNTSSDYRLKNSVAPMTTGLATVSALKPVTYKWNVNDSDGEGFIAHELQEVIPQAAYGKKDAVNEDGSIKPQGVDYSKIVVHLVAAIQELSAKNDALEARLVALESK
jgi:hypothetical protein